MPSVPGWLRHSPFILYTTALHTSGDLMLVDGFR